MLNCLPKRYSLATSGMGFLGLGRGDGGLDTPVFLPNPEFSLPNPVEIPQNPPFAAESLPISERKYRQVFFPGGIRVDGLKLT